MSVRMSEEFPMLDGPAFRRFERSILQTPTEPEEPFTAEKLVDLYRKMKARQPMVNRWLPPGMAVVVDDTALDLPESLKLGRRILLSEDVAMDAGLIPDTRPPYVPEPRPWRWRLRGWLSDRVWAARYRLGYWLIGEDPDDQ